MAQPKKKEKKYGEVRAMDAGSLLQGEELNKNQNINRA